MAKRLSLLFGIFGLMLALAVPAVAQDYPSKPVRILVAFSPGGINDIVARIAATQLTERLGKQFIVENRPGAGGLIAGEALMNAPQDGHTLLVVSLAISVNPWFYKMPYSPVKDFAPVAILATAPNVLSVNKDLPVKSVKDVIALAKSKPGDLKYASAGIGTFMHLGPELFKQMAGIDLLHVPFKGGGPALIDVAGGHTQMTFASVPSTIGPVRSGKVRAIGIGGLKRVAVLPDVPTISESGVPGYECANWIGIVARTGTPDAIVALLHKELTAIQNSAALKKQFDNEGAEIVRKSPAEFGQFIAAETAKWGKVVKDAKMKPQ